MRKNRLIKKLAALVLSGAMLAGCASPAPAGSGTSPAAENGSTGEETAPGGTSSEGAASSEGADPAAGSGGTGSGGTSESAEDGAYSRALAAKNQTQNPGDATLTEIDASLPAEKKTYTVMVYMVGSNLESRHGAATKDLREMESAGLDFGNANLLVYTGGSRKWTGDVPAEHNNVLDLSRGEEERIVAHTAKNSDMGDKETFSTFLNFCHDNYPADHYALICLDHGGGPLWGYGSDELYNNDTLLLSEMKEALLDTPFGSGEKLDFVGFDACLMGGLESANLWKDHADYLIGSEELEPGDGWNYAFLSEFNSTSDPKTVAERIIKEFGDYYAETATEFSNPDVTLSCMDLSKVDSTVAAMNGLFAAIGEDLETERYAEVFRRRGDTKAFGLAAVESKGEGYDIIDLKDFAEQLSALYPEESEALRAAVDELVTVSHSNVDRAGGVSFYFPGDNQKLYREAGRETYTDLTVSEEYRSFLNAYSGKWLGSADVDWTFPAFVTKENEFTLQLSPEQAANMSGAYYSVFRLMEGSGYIPTTIKIRVEPDENNVLHIPMDPKVIISVTDSAEEYVTPPIFIQSESSGGTAQYRSIGIYLTAGNELVTLNVHRDPEVAVTVQQTSGSDTLSIRSIRLNDKEIGQGGKNTVDVTKYRGIACSFGTTLYPVRNAKGQTEPYFNWTRQGFTGYTGQSLENSFHYELCPASEVGYGMAAQVTVEDVNGNTYGSDVQELASMERPAVIEEKTGNGTLYFTRDGDHMVMEGYAGTDTSLVIPEKVQSLPVTVIRSYYYSETSTVEHVELPDSVEKIGNNAFSSWGALKSIRLSKNLKEIGARGFQQCAALESIELPEGLLRIGNEVFDYCGALKSVRLPASLERIGACVFTSCNALTSIETAPGCKACVSADGVLFSADKKTLLAWPGGKGTSYTVPAGTEVLGYGSFAHAPVTDVALPEGLRVIENCAFFECGSLNAPKLPDSLEEVRGMAFSSFGWSSYFMLDEDTRIQDASLHIGKNLTYIGEDAFGEIRFQSFEVSEDNPVYSQRNGLLTNRAGDTVLMAPTVCTGTLVVPEGIVGLENELFEGYPVDTAFVLPDSLVRIGEDVFPYEFGDNNEETGLAEHVYSLTIYCSPGSYAETWAKENGLPVDTEHTPETGTYRVETAETPHGVLTARVYSDHATVLSYDGEDRVLKIPEEISGVPVTGIGSRKDLFVDISIGDISINFSHGEEKKETGDLEELELPKTLGTFYPEAFNECYDLTQIRVAEGNEALKAEKGVLYTADGKELILCPRRNISYQGSYAVPAGVEAIGDYAFQGTSLSAVTLPESLVRIGTCAFADTDLAAVALPAGLQEMGDGAFNSTALSEITIPAGISVIPAEAFHMCRNLAKVTFPEGLTEIGADAFSWDQALTAVSFPGTLSRIGKQAFENCEVLADVQFTEGLKEIGEGAFSGDFAMKSFDLPQSLEKIGKEAFYDSYGHRDDKNRLGDVKIGKLKIGPKVTSIGTAAFGSINCQAFEVDPANPAYAAKDGFLTDKAGTKLLACPASLTGEVKVPDGMTGIGDYAFRDGGSYTAVYIPASVVDIDYYAVSTGFSEKEISVICPAGSAMETHCKMMEIPCTTR